MRRKSCRRYRAAGWAAVVVFLSWTAAMGVQREGLLSLNSHQIVAVRTTKPPVIDGEIGEDEWKAAAVVTSFIQYEPAW